MYEIKLFLTENILHTSTHDLIGDMSLWWLYCTVASGVVVVVVGVCNRSQMRTSKYTCLIFGMSIGLDPVLEMHKRNF